MALAQKKIMPKPSITKQHQPVNLTKQYRKREHAALMVSLAWIVILGCCTIYSSTKVNTQQFDLQQTTQQIAKYQNRNTELHQEVDELESQQHLYDIAHANNMSLQPSQIKTINK